MQMTEWIYYSFQICLFHCEADGFLLKRVHVFWFVYMGFCGLCSLPTVVWSNIRQLCTFKGVTSVKNTPDVITSTNLMLLFLFNHLQISLA